MIKRRALQGKLVKIYALSLSFFPIVELLAQAIY